MSLVASGRVQTCPTSWKLRGEEHSSPPNGRLSSGHAALGLVRCAAAKTNIESSPCTQNRESCNFERGCARQ